MKGKQLLDKSIIGRSPKGWAALSQTWVLFSDSTLVEHMHIVLYFHLRSKACFVAFVNVWLLWPLCRNNP